MKVSVTLSEHIQHHVWIYPMNLFSPSINNPINFMFILRVQKDQRLDLATIKVKRKYLNIIKLIWQNLHSLRDKKSQFLISDGKTCKKIKPRKRKISSSQLHFRVLTACKNTTKNRTSKAIYNRHAVRKRTFVLLGADKNI
jgi:hypothetical protein